MSNAQAQKLIDAMTRQLGMTTGLSGIKRSRAIGYMGENVSLAEPLTQASKWWILQPFSGLRKSVVPIAPRPVRKVVVGQEMVY